jgi:ribonuclease HI
MKLDLLKKFCELQSVEKTADYFGISIDDFFGKVSQICKDLEIDKPLAKKNHLIEPDKPLSVYIDGASSNNPGPAGIGIVFIQDEQIIYTVSKYIGEKTNNEAEYTALIEALNLVLDQDIKSIKVFSDSELVVKQIKGIYAVKQEHLKKLNKEALSLIEKFDHFEINHVARGLNAKADKLAKSAIEHNGKLTHK